jgi:hypothetical protein
MRGFKIGRRATPLRVDGTIVSAGLYRKEACA